MDGDLPVVISPGKCGAQVDILKYLEWYLEKLDPMLANDKPIDLKFVFDGGRMTSRQYKVQEIGTFDLLFAGQLLLAVHSPDNSHQWAIVFGEETRENLCKELATGFQTIQQLRQGKY